VKLTDLPMLLSIISIAVSLLCLFAFQIWSIIGDLQGTSGFFNSNRADCIANSFDSMKLTFLFFAFTFDLYKWCVFIAATGTTKNKELLESRTKKLTIVLIVTQISIFLAFSVFIIGVLLSGSPLHDPPEKYKKWMKYEHNFNMGLFLIFLGLYITTLILLTQRLKKLFPSFYQKEKKKLYIASFSIIFSIIARVAINFIYSIQEVWDALQKSYDLNTWAFPIS